MIEKIIALLPELKNDANIRNPTKSVEIRTKIKCLLIDLPEEDKLKVKDIYLETFNFLMLDLKSMLAEIKSLPKEKLASEISVS